METISLLESSSSDEGTKLPSRKRQRRPSGRSVSAAAENGAALDATPTTNGPRKARRKSGHNAAPAGPVGTTGMPPLDDSALGSGAIVVSSDFVRITSPTPSHSNPSSASRQDSRGSRRKSGQPGQLLTNIPTNDHADVGEDGDDDDDDDVIIVPQHRTTIWPEMLRAQPSTAEFLSMDDLFDQTDVVESAPSVYRRENVAAPSFVIYKGPNAIVEESDDEDIVESGIPFAQAEPIPVATASVREILRRTVTPPPDSPTAPPSLWLSQAMSQLTAPAVTTLREGATGKLSIDSPVQRQITIEMHIHSEDESQPTKTCTFDIKDDEYFNRVAARLARDAVVPSKDVVLTYKGAKLSLWATPKQLNMQPYEDLEVFPNEQTYLRVKEAEKRRVATLTAAAEASLKSREHELALSSSTSGAASAPTGTQDDEANQADDKIRIKVRDHAGHEFKALPSRSRPVKALLEAFCKKYAPEAMNNAVLVDPDGEDMDPDMTIEDSGLEDDDLITIRF